MGRTNLAAKHSSAIGRRFSSFGRNLKKRLTAYPMFYRRPGPVDIAAAGTLVVLVIFGLVMLFSASYATGYYRWNDSFRFIRPQILYALLGLALMFVVSRIDYRWLRGFTGGMYAFTALLLVVVLFMPAIGGHHRWINIPHLPTIQVSEIAKFTLIMALANVMDLHRDRMGQAKYGLLAPLTLCGIFCLLILPETHYSAIVLILCITVTMMWSGGVDLKWFATAIAVGSLMLTVVLVTGHDYVKKRFAGWLDPFSDVENTTRQTAQSLYAVGSGGLFGRGLGNSRQKHLWLPEVTNDFIFSILCEELGFVGAAFCIALFAALIIRGVRIALRAPDRFSGLVCIGIVAQIGFQALFNIAVVTNSVPNTGISLPFFSSGGTSLVMMLAEAGILLSISRAGNAAALEKKKKAQAARKTGGPAEHQEGTL